MGRPTSTDRINERKYIFKPVTFLMTSIVSNIIITFIIKTQDQMRVLPVTEISYRVDLMILLAYGTMLVAA